MKFFDAVARTTQFTVKDFIQIFSECDEGCIWALYITFPCLFLPPHLGYLLYKGINESIKYPSYENYQEQEVIHYLESIKDSTPQLKNKFLKSIEIKYQQPEQFIQSEYTENISKQLLNILASDRNCDEKFTAIKYYLT